MRALNKHSLSIPTNFDNSEQISDDSQEAFDDKETGKLLSVNPNCSDSDVTDTVAPETKHGRFGRKFADFSNVFKAFIGSSLIGLPFAMSKAGIILGTIGMLVIAVLTDHCCHLIVKCKRYAIDKTCDQMEEKGADEFTVLKRREYLGVRMSYGQIGKVAMGRVGSILVNTSVMITQFGFCTGYFIFFGNTLRSVIFTLMHHDVKGMVNSTTNASAIKTTLPPFTTSVMPRTTIPSSVSTSNHSINFTNTEMPDLLKTVMLPLFAHSGNTTNGTSVIHSINKLLKQPLSHDKLQSNNQWTFALLCAMPLPLLILISFVRHIRKLAPISVIANASITAAFVATALFIIIEYQAPHESIVYFNVGTFPVFFGQVTAAFEGIGTVIPIEGSMAENRKNYPCYLHISLGLLTTILGSFGILGYARYGAEVRQIVTENLTGITIANCLRLLLFVGVLFTYPLQIYPVIQITESALFGRRGICRSRGGVYRFAGENRIKSEEPALSEVRISPWKRYITRTLLVLSTAVLAIIFRSQFAYIAALTGSVGSALLSFILPCIFHMNLKKGTLSLGLKAKDCFLVCFGVVGGVLGVVVTVQKIIESYDVHHPIKV